MTILHQNGVPINKTAFVSPNNRKFCVARWDTPVSVTSRECAYSKLAAMFNTETLVIKKPFRSQGRGLNYVHTKREFDSSMYTAFEYGCGYEFVMVQPYVCFNEASMFVVGGKVTHAVLTLHPRFEQERFKRYEGMYCALNAVHNTRECETVALRAVSLLRSKGISCPAMRVDLAVVNSKIQIDETGNLICHNVGDFKFINEISGPEADVFYDGDQTLDFFSEMHAKEIVREIAEELRGQRSMALEHNNKWMNPLWSINEDQPDGAKADSVRSSLTGSPDEDGAQVENGAKADSVRSSLTGSHNEAESVRSSLTGSHNEAESVRSSLTGSPDEDGAQVENGAQADSVRSSLTGSPDEDGAKVQSDGAQVENGATVRPSLTKTQTPAATSANLSRTQSCCKQPAICVPRLATEASPFKPTNISRIGAFSSDVAEASVQHGCKCLTNAASVMKYKADTEKAKVEVARLRAEAAQLRAEATQREAELKTRYPLHVDPLTGPTKEQWICTYNVLNAQKKQLPNSALHAISIQRLGVNPSTGHGWGGRPQTWVQLENNLKPDVINKTLNRKTKSLDDFVTMAVNMHNPVKEANTEARSRINEARSEVHGRKVGLVSKYVARDKKLFADCTATWGCCSKEITYEQLEELRCRMGWSGTDFIRRFMKKTVNAKFSMGKGKHRDLVKHRTFMYEKGIGQDCGGRKVPYARIKDFEPALVAILKELEPLLMWPPNVSADRLPVQFQWDKGGGSVKMLVKFLLLPRANSVHSTWLIAHAEAKNDDYQLYSTVFKPLFDSLNKLNTIQVCIHSQPVMLSGFFKTTLIEYIRKTLHQLEGLDANGTNNLCSKAKLEHNLQRAVWALTGSQCEEIAAAKKLLQTPDVERDEIPFQSTLKGAKSEDAPTDPAKDAQVTTAPAAPASAYEQWRAQNIQRNKEYLAANGIQEAVAAVKRDTSTKQAGAKPKKMQICKHVRRSSRCQSTNEVLPLAECEELTDNRMQMDAEGDENTCSKAQLCAIGSRVEIYWEKMQVWYSGQILDHNDTDGHKVRYDDKEIYWENLAQAPWVKKRSPSDEELANQDKVVWRPCLVAEVKEAMQQRRQRQAALKATEAMKQAHMEALGGEASTNRGVLKQHNEPKAKARREQEKKEAKELLACAAAATREKSLAQAKAQERMVQAKEAKMVPWMEVHHSHNDKKWKMESCGQLANKHGFLNSWVALPPVHNISADLATCIPLGEGERSEQSGCEQVKSSKQDPPANVHTWQFKQRKRLQAKVRKLQAAMKVAQKELKENEVAVRKAQEAGAQTRYATADSMRPSLTGSVVAAQDAKTSSRLKKLETMQPILKQRCEAARVELKHSLEVMSKTAKRAIAEQPVKIFLNESNKMLSEDCWHCRRCSVDEIISCQESWCEGHSNQRSWKCLQAYTGTDLLAYAEVQQKADIGQSSCGCLCCEWTKYQLAYGTPQGAKVLPKFAHLDNRTPLQKNPPRVTAQTAKAYGKAYRAALAKQKECVSSEGAQCHIAHNKKSTTCPAPKPRDYCGYVGEGLIAADPDDFFSGTPLHVHIGVVNRLLKEFEKECTRLDATVGGVSSAQAIKLQAELRAINELLAKLEDVYVERHGSLNLVESRRLEIREQNPNIDFGKKRKSKQIQETHAQVLEEEVTLKEQVKEITQAQEDNWECQTRLKAHAERLQLAIDTMSGPAQTECRAILESLRLERQVWHSGELNGTDCTKVVKQSTVLLFMEVLAGSPGHRRNRHRRKIDQLVHQHLTALQKRKEEFNSGGCDCDDITSLLNDAQTTRIAIQSCMADVETQSAEVGVDVHTKRQDLENEAPQASRSIDDEMSFANHWEQLGCGFKLHVVQKFLCSESKSLTLQTGQGIRHARGITRCFDFPGLSALASGHGKEACVTLTKKKAFTTMKHHNEGIRIKVSNTKAGPKCTKQKRTKLAQKYYHAFMKYAQLFQYFRPCRCLCKHEVALHELRSYSYGNWFPVAFTECSMSTLMCKFHILIDEHTRQIQRQWSCGWLTEEVIESAHQVQGRMQSLTRSIRRHGDRMEAILANWQHRMHSDHLQQLKGQTGVAQKNAKEAAVEKKLQTKAARNQSGKQSRIQVTMRSSSTGSYQDGATRIKRRNPLENMCVNKAVEVSGGVKADKGWCDTQAHGAAPVNLIPNLYFEHQVHKRCAIHATNMYMQKAGEATMANMVEAAKKITASDRKGNKIPLENKDNQVYHPEYGNFDPRAIVAWFRLRGQELQTHQLQASTCLLEKLSHLSRALLIRKDHVTALVKDNDIWYHLDSEEPGAVELVSVLDELNVGPKYLLFVQ